MKIELYQIPPIFSSYQPFEFAEQVRNKLEADKKLLEAYPTIQNQITHKKNEYIYHWLMVDGTMMTAAIAEKSLTVLESGWFLWLQNFNFCLGIPFNTIDERYTYWFDKYFDKYFIAYPDTTRYFYDAIQCYKNNLFFSCVCSLFSIMEFYQRRISNFDGNTIFSMKKALDNSAVPDIKGYKLYYCAFEDKLNTYLKKNMYAISVESNPEPPVINRNRIMHGILTREFNKTDCLKLFCIVSSMAGFNSWLSSLANMHQLSNEINMLYNTDGDK